MDFLNKDQVKLIESDVDNARITLSHLQHELVDHICCEVESLMDSGKSFEEAYMLLKEQTGIQVLQKIQENTLYLTDKNYALMKTAMKITGNISLAMLGIGTLLKISHMPGATIILFLGFVLLCLVFFPAVIYLNYKEQKEPGKLALHLSILAGGILFMTGVLFKVMHWPGASLMLSSGFTFILWVFIPILLFGKLRAPGTAAEKRVYVLGGIGLMIFETSFMFKLFHWPGAAPLMLLGSVLLVVGFLPLFTRIRKSEMSTGQFIFIITLSMQAVALTALLSLNLSTPVLESFAREESNASRIARYFEQKKDRQPLASSTADSLHRKAEEQLRTLTGKAGKLHDLILQIKLKLIQEPGRQTTLTAVPETSQIQGLDSNAPADLILIGENGNGLAKPLKEQLESFRKNACELTASNPELAGNIAVLLNTSDAAENAEYRSWENACFRNNTLIGTLALLSTIEKNVRMVESATARHLLQNL